MSLAEHVRIVRTQRLALTQLELANEMGINPMAVSRWERGKSEPSMANLRKLAQLADLPIAAFFSETEAVA